jgi:hypothetical protein
MKMLTDLIGSPWGENQEIQLSQGGKTMPVTHSGTLGTFQNVLVCPNIRKNLCGLQRLTQNGYGFSYFPHESIQGGSRCWITETSTGIKVMGCELDQNVGLPYLRLTDFMKLTANNEAQSVDMLEGFKYDVEGNLEAVTTPMLPRIVSKEREDAVKELHKTSLESGKWHAAVNDQESDDDHGGTTVCKDSVYMEVDGELVLMTRAQAEARWNMLEAQQAAEQQMHGEDGMGGEQDDY